MNGKVPAPKLAGQAPGAGEVIPEEDGGGTRTQGVGTAAKPRQPKVRRRSRGLRGRALGSEMMVDLKLEEDLFKARTGLTNRVHIVEKVWMGFDRYRMHIFDKKTMGTTF